MDKNKVVVGVFVLIAVLIISLIVWSITLGQNGIIQAGWNSMANNINTVWTTITGDTEGPVPEWRIENSNIQEGIDGIEGDI